ncbi:MAG: hypothetical protein ACREJ3_12165 [Polyangiaceae bacterium]
MRKLRFGSSGQLMVHFTGATFDFDGQKWAIVRGPQRPEAAQRIDATAWLKHAEGAAHAVALPDPKTTHGRHDLALPAFRARYQAAVWHGLSLGRGARRPLPARRRN